MRITRAIAVPLLFLTAALFTAGCGGGDGDSKDSAGTKDGAGSSLIKTPPPLEAGGELVVCTDVPYPPAEFIEDGKFVGYEIDLMDEVADRIGVTTEYEKTLFDAIIPSLQGKKCDAIISSMNVTPEREKAVNFVPYMEIGQSIMVRGGEAEGISSLEDLAGKSVAVQVGTTLKATLEEVSADLDDPIDVQTFPDAGAAAAAVKGQKVDAFFGDSPLVAEYVVKDPKSFEFAGEPIDPLPVGIATRLEDTELQDAIQKAVDSMYEDGTMKELLAKWNVEDFMLSDSAEEA